MHVSELLLFSCSFLISFEKGQCCFLAADTDAGETERLRNQHHGKRTSHCSVDHTWLSCQKSSKESYFVEGKTKFLQMVLSRSLLYLNCYNCWRNFEVFNFNCNTICGVPRPSYITNTTMNQIVRKCRNFLCKEKASNAKFPLLVYEWVRTGLFSVSVAQTINHLFIWCSMFLNLNND